MYKRIVTLLILLASSSSALRPISVASANLQSNIEQVRDIYNVPSAQINFDEE